MLVEKLEKEEPDKKPFALPWKHFAFGHLVVNSDHTINLYRQLKWVYHVAPIIKLSDGEAYVLDPTLSSIPVKKEIWYGKLQQKDAVGGDDEGHITGIVTCLHAAYEKKYKCFNPDSKFPIINDDVIENELQNLLYQ